MLAAFVLASQANVVKRQARPCPDDCENKPLDISFIVDASASISRGNFTEGLWFIQNFVDEFDIGPEQVRISMVTFGDRVYEEDAFDFADHTDKVSLNHAITSVPHRGGSSTETGMAINWYLSHQHPETREGVRSVVIVLTDGNSQLTKVTKDAAKVAQEKGVEVFAIGVGGSVSQEELHNIASDAEHVFVVNEYRALEDIRHRLTYEACGVKPQPECSFSAVDVCFVLDASRSIGSSNFVLELEFVKEFLDVFKINPSSARVAVVMFGNRVYDEHVINFDSHTSKKDTLDAVLGLTYMNGNRTETGAAIDYMIDNFVPHFRPHAAHIGIVITDGKSQNWQFTEETAQKAREAGITTVAVGVGKVGPDLDQKELDDIAGDASRVITADNYAQLNEIREKLLDITCEGIKRELRALAPSEE